MKKIAISNYKGGVGKTTVTLNMGQELASRGYKVLLIDFDMQGNLTKNMGITLPDEVPAENTIAAAIEAIMEDRTPELKIFSANGLDFCCCNVRFAKVRMKMEMALARETLLKKLMEHIEDTCDYDYILLDTAPSIGVDLFNAYAAVDEILLVVNPAIFSIDGLDYMMEMMLRVKKLFNPDLEFAGILINRANTRTNFTQDAIAVIRKGWDNAKVFDTVIPASIRVEESQALHTSIQKHAPTNAVSIAYRDFIDEYLKTN